LVFGLLVTSDALLTIGGLFIAYQVRYFQGLDTPFVKNAPILPLWYLLLMAAVWLAVFRQFGLYERRNLVIGIGEYRRVATAGLVTTLAVIVFAYIRLQPYISRGFLLVAMISVVVLVSAGRFLVRRFIYSSTARGLPLDRILVVGSSRHAVSVATQLGDSVSSSAEVVGFLTEYLPRGTHLVRGLRVLGEPLELEKVANQTGATRALVVESGLSWESLHAMVTHMHRRDGIVVSILPGLHDLHVTQMVPEQIGPVLALTTAPARIVGVDAVLKRALELGIVVPALILALPVMGVFAALGLLAGRGVGVVHERVTSLAFPTCSMCC
jgi:FlaA1/EpsC-like NDP-sugar epimerase